MTRKIINRVKKKNRAVKNFKGIRAMLPVSGFFVPAVGKTDHNSTPPAGAAEHFLFALRPFERYMVCLLLC